ncbi:hypothetical protein GCM10023200_19700 [Actinomycetospora chlora]|uniref:S1 motif domain-containing protein n=1 Tax=Actinomycetospora chlora TaxID=663608 RepID=A0ABP9AV17_9PSEU
MTNTLMRDERPREGHVFVVMPYGVKQLDDGTLFDFDQYYEQELRPIITAVGMVPVRADSIYGPQSVLTAMWRGLQQAAIVLIDWTTRSPNVALEFGFGHLIGKKMIHLTQQPDDIPTDVRGSMRHIAYSAHFADVHRMRQELSRQLEAVALEPWVEMALVPMAAGGTDPVPARVINTAKEFIVIETGDGRRGVLGNADVEYDRIVPDMTRRFAVGDQLSGAFDVDTSGGMKYTLLAGTPNPWPLIQAEFPEGRTFTSTVARTADKLGAFVPLAHGIDGLVHVSALGSRTLAPGDTVEVTVARVDVERRRVALHLHAVSGRAAAPASSPESRGGEGGLRVGQLLEGEVVKAVPEGQGGYVLVRLPGRVRPAMLHCRYMTPELRADLNAGEVERGEIVDVEIVSVDDARDRVVVRDVPDDGSHEGEAASSELPLAS